MAIIVEDGTIVANSNSYVTAAELESYAVERGITLSAGAEVLLHQSMDYIESLNFIGDRFSREQSLVFPRVNVYIDGFYYEPAIIPDLLKNGQMATAIAIDTGANPLSTISPEVKKEKVDVIEVEYKESGLQAAIARTISASLYKLIKGGMGLNASVKRV